MSSFVTYSLFLVIFFAFCWDSSLWPLWQWSWWLQDLPRPLSWERDNCTFRTCHCRYILRDNFVPRHIILYLSMQTFCHLLTLYYVYPRCKSWLSALYVILRNFVMALFSALSGSLWPDWTSWSPKAHLWMGSCWLTADKMPFIPYL